MLLKQVIFSEIFYNMNSILNYFTHSQRVIYLMSTCIKPWDSGLLLYSLSIFIFLSLYNFHLPNYPPIDSNQIELYPLFQQYGIAYI